jgi:hypothetical protein
MNNALTAIIIAIGGSGDAAGGDSGEVATAEAIDGRRPFTGTGMAA